MPGVSAVSSAPSTISGTSLIVSFRFRSRKLKCDKGSPCANCTKISRPCVFIASGLDADAQKRLAEVKEKMGVLERSLEEDVARLSRPGSKHASHPRRPNTLPGQEESHSDQEDDEDTKDLNLSSFVTEDAAYYDDEANNDDDVLDLGIAIGKMRITERIGGLVRPRLAEEVSAFRVVPVVHLISELIVCHGAASPSATRRCQTESYSGSRPSRLASA
jgi:hypothetical protein